MHTQSLGFANFNTASFSANISFSDKDDSKMWKVGFVSTFLEAVATMVPSWLMAMQASSFSCALIVTGENEASGSVRDKSCSTSGLFDFAQGSDRNVSLFTDPRENTALMHRREKLNVVSVSEPKTRTSDIQSILF